MTERCRVRKLRTGVHVTLVVVFEDDHLVVAVCRAERRAHADVHAAVARDHDERGVLAFRTSGSSPRRMRS